MTRKKSDGRMTSRIKDKIESKNLRCSYWGRDFIRYFGKERDEYYTKRFGHTLPLPRGLRVPTDNGVSVDEYGRVSVAVVDNPDMKTISIKEAIGKVSDLFAKGRR